MRGVSEVQIGKTKAPQVLELESYVLARILVSYFTSKYDNPNFGYNFYPVYLKLLRT